MGGEFSLDSAGLSPLADVHSRVAEGLSQLTGAGGPQVADVVRSFGNIAFAVNTALDGVTQSRGNTLQTTKGSSDTIAELLGTADRLYAQGDQEGAAKLRAAAETLEGSGAASSAGASGAATGAGSTGAGAGAGGGSEMAGQVGQQVGQIAQGIAQSVQGLAQGLTQLPQQIMQGIQGVTGSDATESEAEKVAKANEENAGDPDERERKDAEKHAEEERAQRQAPGAQPGQAAEGGRVPEPPPAAERPQLAQTRPQQSSL